MSPSQPDPLLRLLRDAFVLAEDRLRGEENRAITQAITNEAKNVQYEASLNGVLRSALSDTFSGCSVRLDYNNVDICVIRDFSIVASVESKGMVANSLSREDNRSPLDLHGINTKLNRDARDENSVQKDIAEITRKIPDHLQRPLFELFVPVIYELYRSGAVSDRDIYSGKKPWATPWEFKSLRLNVKNELVTWFQREDPQFKLIHAAEFVELRDANELWRKQVGQKYPGLGISQAFVSFYAFGRSIEVE